MILVGTSGALGRYIQLAPSLTICIRGILAFMLLWGYCKFRGITLKIERGHRLPVILSGLFMGAHWVTYFYSLQLSNVAIGMLSLFTYPVITAFLEPLILKTKLQRVHLFLGFLVLVGVYFLVPDFDFGNSSTLAVLIGLFSAVLYSLRNIILKKRVAEYNGSSLMTWQMAIVAIGLFPFFFWEDSGQALSQLPWIFTLALVTTAIGHTLFLKCFRYFSITSISILSSIQPIYGILLGALFLKEFPSLTTIGGGVLILSAVVIESYRNRKIS
ncbi:DMT family transporter [Muricauda sp. DJ-13]|uniref:DMT family transporter n=2 Tax=Croceivirga thetidis TaxID=2721623 RepID=A0ABX1GRF2_9FLAO|nr:DMT family transporter [Croceivirga thetidis]